jgi:hypothetical protein
MDGFTADSSAVRTVQRAIAQLQDRARLRSNLKAKAARPTLTSKTGIGTRLAANSSISTELRELTSTDGLFVLQYQHVILPGEQS